MRQGGGKELKDVRGTFRGDVSETSRSTLFLAEPISLECCKSLLHSKVAASALLEYLDTISED